MSKDKFYDAHGAEVSEDEFFRTSPPSTVKLNIAETVFVAFLLLIGAILAWGACGPSD